jgi:2-aminoethylphosphonate-pyruvate transaminase
MNFIFFKRYAKKVNKNKPLFTPGPAAISEENLSGLGPAFGRGDLEFKDTATAVENWLKKLTGKSNVLSLQGSGSLACEIAVNNFLHGEILVIKSGFYSDRLYKMVSQKFDSNSIDYIEYEDLFKIKKNYQWVVACYVETSNAFKLDLHVLNDLALKCNSKLLIDATASIGLEKDHYLADVICFSSCKGLFGLTGAAFIAFEEKPSNKNRKSFYLDFETHYNHLITGPYHALQSLVNVIPVHEQMVRSVRKNKEVFLEKFKNYIVHAESNQPLIATLVNAKIISSDKNAILYSPRKVTSGSIISHLGEVYLKHKAKGKLNKLLEIAQ